MAWRLPAEWEPQQTIWMVWPRDATTWPGPHLERARAAMLGAIKAVAASQRVDLVVHPELEPPRLAGNVHLHRIEHVDSWIRDYGPLTVVDDKGARRAFDFRFDAWGGKYESLAKDDGVTARLAAAGAIDIPERVEAVLEGGAIDTDGQGTFLCTRSVVQARGQSEEEVEGLLRTHLGARRVIWLEAGIMGDDTDGHIDTIARFVAPGRVVAATAQPAHPDHASLFHNLQALRKANDARGQPLELLHLPSPAPLRTDEGDILPAGHANFLVANDVVLLPTYGGDSDTHARRVLQRAFPSRRVVDVDHRSLIWGFGGIHCLSMQVPRAGAPLDAPVI